jgi:hypothetical protein
MGQRSPQGDAEESLLGIKKEPNQLPAQVSLTVALIQAAKEDEARVEAAKVLRINPKFSVESFARVLPAKDQKVIDDLVSALLKGGLK